MPFDPPCDITGTATVVVAGVTGVAACLAANQTYNMTNAGPGQVWAATVGAWTATLTLTAAPYQLTVNRGIVVTTYDAASFDCQGNNTFNFVSSAGPCGWPATLSVSGPGGGTAADTPEQSYPASTWVYKVRHDPARAPHCLSVTFKDRTGRPYYTARYINTSRADYELMLVAASKGRHVHGFLGGKAYVDAPLDV